ncbi:MAG: chemotaxis protein CheR [Desulfobacteraceae bacterium]|nr:MAG: chemotaxis protein CheR [Desulfobacteraceae bacterium]
MSDTRISPEQYQKLSQIVYKESGIVLNEKKYNLLVARLAKRMRKTRIPNVSAYIKRIASDEKEFGEFIDATTTNHTYFFRENKHCEFLLRTLKPEKPLKIWSAASSSGEEPFSIAVQFLDQNFEFSILASDVSDSMLNLGRQAVYPVERVKEVPKPMLHTYFQKGKNSRAGYVRMKPFVRERVTFAKHNLLSDEPKEMYDIIFCRNVMIYFDAPTRQKVVTTLLRALHPGGYLFVGLSESLHGLDHNVTPVVPSGYRKK